MPNPNLDNSKKFSFIEAVLATVVITEKTRFTDWNTFQFIRAIKEEWPFVLFTGRTFRGDAYNADNFKEFIDKFEKQFFAVQLETRDPKYPGLTTGKFLKPFSVDLDSKPTYLKSNKLYRVDGLNPKLYDDDMRTRYVEPLILSRVHLVPEKLVSIGSNILFP